MDSSTNIAAPPPAPTDTRLGTIIRLAFFVASVLIGLLFLTTLLVHIVNAVVAGTVGLCLTGLLANLLTMQIFDRRPLVDIGLHFSRSSTHHLLIGLGFGGGAAALMLVAPLISGTGHLVARQNSTFSWLSLVSTLAALFLAALGEEMIFRGYGFQLMIRNMGPFATILPVGVIFGLAHSGNPYSAPLGVLNTVLWGILLGYAFFRSHDLWLPIGLHYGWNAVLPLFGANLSGLTIEVTRYFYRWDLSPLWSGGNYGPEGGLLATIFAIALWVALMRTPIKPQHAAIATNLNDSL